MSDSVLVKDSEVTYLTSSYDRDGVSVKYGRAAVAVVLNPYNGKYELAIKPYYKDDSGEWVETYSFEDDLKYKECMRIMAMHQEAGNPFPKEEQAFVDQLLDKKNRIRKQANAYVTEHSRFDDVETGYGMNKWRESVVGCEAAVKLLSDYLKAKK